VSLDELLIVMKYNIEVIPEHISIKKNMKLFKNAGQRIAPIR